MSYGRMAASSYVKMTADNALRKSGDLVRVGKPAAALQTLRAVISRKNRTWQAVYEKIIMKYIELAVDARRNIKDVLMQYRGMTQVTQPASLQRVMTAYLDAVMKKLDLIQADANKLSGNVGISKVLDVIEETPMSILANLDVKAESSSAALDKRKELVLWVKYTWETCRVMLDVLRNNDNMQSFYHQTARRAFQFCLKYKRTTEFTVICKKIRDHIVTITKHQSQQNSVELNSPESQEMYLRTRFAQLRVAADLEQWQEAYRTIEDIHNSMMLAPSQPPASLMVIYYEKLSQIFWASKNYLFHAYSLNKFFELSAVITKNMTAEAKQEMASAVVVATIVIPISENETQDDFLDSENESNLRLAELMGFRREIPTRKRLLQGFRGGLLSLASPECQALVNLLEDKFGPLQMKSGLEPLLKKIEASKTLGHYASAVRETATLRLLGQLSTVFSTMKVARLSKVLPSGLTMTQVERLVIESNSKGITRIRFDHRKQLVHFSDEDFTFRSAPIQLSTLSRALQQIVGTVIPVDQIKKKKERSMVFKLVAEGMEEEHTAIFQRMKMIEMRKQHTEEQQKEVAIQDQQEKKQKAKARAEEERKRLLVERLAREQEKERREKEAKEKRQLALLAKKLEMQVEASGAARRTNKKITKALGNLENVKAEDLTRMQEKVEAEAKARLDEDLMRDLKQLNYLTRALRIEEEDLLIQQSKRQMLEDKEAVEREFKDYAVQHKKKFDSEQNDRKRLARMSVHANAVRAKTDERRRDVHAKKMADYEARRERWLEEQRERHEAEREARSAREEEEERIRQEKEEQRIEAERRSREKEESDKAKKESADAQESKLRAIEDKQRAREAEIEKKDEERRNKAQLANNDDMGGGWSTGRKPKNEGGAWRPKNTSGSRFTRGSDDRDSNRDDSRFGNLRSGNDRDSNRPTGRFNRGGDDRDSNRPTGRFNRGGDDRDSNRPTGRFNRGDNDPDSNRPTGRFNRGGDDPDSNRPTGRFNRGDNDPDSNRPTSRFNRGGDDRDSNRPTGRFNRGGDDSSSGNRGGDDRDSNRPTGRFNRGGDDSGSSNSRFSRGGDDSGSSNSRFGNRGGDRDSGSSSRFGNRGGDDSGRGGRFSRGGDDSGSSSSRQSDSSSSRFGNRGGDDRDSGSSSRFGNRGGDNRDGNRPSRFNRGDDNGPSNSGSRFGGDSNRPTRFNRGDDSSSSGGRFGASRGNDRDASRGGPSRDADTGGGWRRSGSSGGGGNRDNRDTRSSRDSQSGGSRYVPPSQRNKKPDAPADSDGFTQVQGRRR